MKITVVHIDVPMPRWVRRVALLGVPVAAMAITSAAIGTPTAFKAGDPVSAALINENFKELADKAVTMTAWQPATQVNLFDATGTAPIPNQSTKATWRRVGDTMEVHLITTFSQPPASGTSFYLWSIPQGEAADQAKLPSPLVGSGSIYTTNSQVLMAFSRPTSPRFIYAISQNSGTFVGDSVPVAFNAGNAIELTFSVPIEGWDVDGP